MSIKTKVCVNRYTGDMFRLSTARVVCQRNLATTKMVTAKAQIFFIKCIQKPELEDSPYLIRLYFINRLKYREAVGAKIH